MRTFVLELCVVLAVIVGYSCQANAETIVKFWNFDDVAVVPDKDGNTVGVNQGITSETGWTQWKIDPNYATNWELGMPNFTAKSILNPTGAYSSPNCVATSLNFSYADWADNATPAKVLELYTPVIDLTSLTDATLSFKDFMRVEGGVDPSYSAYDYCAINVYDSTGTTLLGQVAPKILDYDDISSGWHSKSYSLNSYVGQSVKIGFGLYVDNTGNYQGWFIDDVKVATSQSAPEPCTLMLLGSGALWLLRRKRA